MLISTTPDDFVSVPEGNEERGRYVFRREDHALWSHSCPPSPSAPFASLLTMAGSPRVALFLGAVASTLIFSAITLVLIFIPYPSNTINYRLVASTSTPLPQGQYLTTAVGYTNSPVAGQTVIGYDDGSSSTYDVTSNSLVYYSTVYTAATGFPYGFPSSGTSTFVTSDISYIDTQSPTATITSTAANGEVRTSTLYSQGYATAYSTYTTTQAFRTYPGPYRRDAVETVTVTAATPSVTTGQPHIGRQVDSSNAGSSTTSTMTPLPSNTSAQVRAITVGPVVIIWLLVSSVLFIFIALNVGIYYLWKGRKLHRENAERQEAAAAAGTGTAGHPEMQQHAHQQAPQPLDAGHGNDAEEGATTSSPASQKKPIPLRHARSNATCLFIVAILMLIPLGLMVYSAAHFSGNDDYDVGGLSTSYSWSSFSSSGSCLPLDGSAPTSSYYGNYYSNAADGSSCPAGQGMYEATGSLPFSKYALPVVLVLVFGWLLFVSAMTLGVIVCLNRGETRKQRKARKAAEAQKNIMMEAWTAGWQAQQQYADAHRDRSYGQPQQRSAAWQGSWTGGQGGSHRYNPLPTTPHEVQQNEITYEDGVRDEGLAHTRNDADSTVGHQHRSSGGIAL